MDGSGMAVFVAKLPTFVKISKTKFQSLPFCSAGHKKAAAPEWGRLLGVLLRLSDGYFEGACADADYVDAACQPIDAVLTCGAHT